MRRGSIAVLGREYPLCFSTRVACDVEEKFGGLSALSDAMTKGGLGAQLRAVMWTLAEMIRAGCAHAAMTGEAAPEPLTEEQLLDAFGPEDLVDLYGKVVRTIVDDTQRKVEAEPPKNA